MLAELHGFPDAAALVNRIKELSGKNYGLAGRAFLDALTALDRSGIEERLAKEIDAASAMLCPDDADAQVRRVAKRFALVQLAGILAQEFGILPEELDPMAELNPALMTG